MVFGKLAQHWLAFIHGQDLGKMFDWFNQVGYSADIPTLRRDYPEVGWHTLEEWAKAQDWGARLR